MSGTKSRAFTLIELLVVVAIIGILSSVVLTSLNSARQKGRDARRVSDIKQIQLALELYYDAFKAYPVTIGTGPTSVLVTNGFIASLPTDPSNAAGYSYRPYSSTASAAICSSYHLGSSLESGSTHVALQSDADLTAIPSGMQICTGGASPDFSGADSGKCNSSPADIGSSCFDVRP